MSVILQAAEHVKRVVEEEEAKRFTRLTQAELDAIHTYQFTTPTSPKPGFVYKREQWRVGGVNWHGPDEMSVRWAISKQKGMRSWYRGPLESFWLVYTCVQDDADPRYVLHISREAKVIS